jgi:myo-inosose-2 dehydratase
MALRIGINPIVWSNDDLPELGGDIPLERCLKEAAAAGYQGLELGNKFPREYQALKAALDPHGLACVSGWHSLFLLERDVDAELSAMSEHNALLSAMDCEVVIVCEMSRGVHPDLNAPLSGRPLMSDAEWKTFCAHLSALAMRLETEGLKLAYHHHMGTVIQTEAEVDRLMAQTDESVGLLLDTGHLAFAGGDPLAVARRHSARIVHVHAKDVRTGVMKKAQEEDWSFLHAVKEGVFTVPGDGSVDYPKLARILEEGGYTDGWVVVEAEQDPKKAPPDIYARRGGAAVQKAFGLG